MRLYQNFNVDMRTCENLKSMHRHTHAAQPTHAMFAIRIGGMGSNAAMPCPHLSAHPLNVGARATPTHSEADNQSEDRSKDEYILLYDFE